MVDSQLPGGGQDVLILPAVSLSRISPPRGGEYLHEVTAGSISPLVVHCEPLLPAVVRAGRARDRGEVEIEAVVETPEQRPWRSGGETAEHDDAVNLVPGP